MKSKQAHGRLLHFLKTLYQQCADDPNLAALPLTIWELPEKFSYHYPIGELLACTNEDFSELFEQLEGHNVYFGHGLRRPGLDSSTRGTKKEVQCITAWVLDVDMFDPEAPEAHKAKGELPRTIEDLEAILEVGPLPTAIVHTGYGYHPYWVFEEPVVLTCKAERDAAHKAFGKFQKQYIDRAKELGFHLDSTSTIDRVWRLPGSHNCKADNKRPLVEVVFESDERLPAPMSSSDSSHLAQAQSIDKAPEGDKAATKKPEAAELSSEIPDITIAKLKKLKDPERKKAFTAIFAGKSFAERGERDDMLQRVCSSLAWANENNSTPEALAELLRPSLQCWADEPDAEKDVEEELEKAIEKISRAMEDFGTFKQKQVAQLESLRKVLVPGAAPDFRHLALQRDTFFHVYCFGEERYWPACTSRELPLVIRDAWPEGESPVDLSYFDAKGNLKKKPMGQVLDEYGTVIREVTYTINGSETRYDPSTRSLRVPTAPMRNIEAKYHAEIDEWLHLLPARKHHVDMLLDWVSTLTLLDRMSAALYLSGPKSTGKSLFVSGLARLWPSGASKLEHVFTRFNDSILASPLINADENWSDQSVNLCAELRELVGNMVHRVESKGKCIVTVEGAVRLVITANNETLLQTRGNGDQNQYEREATIERILHVPTSNKAAKFLKSIRNRHLWREEDMIAQHALWLKNERAESVVTRALEEGHRFLIQGDETDLDFYDGIGSKPKDHDAAVAWLAAVFLRPNIPTVRDKVQISGNRFAVVPRALCDTWKSLGLEDHGFERPSSSNAASRLLRPFLGPRTKVGDHNAYKIDIKRFARAAKIEGLVTQKQLEEKFGSDV